MKKVAAILFVLGLLCLLAFKLIGSHVDASGALREPFALMPVGLGLTLAGFILWFAARLKEK